MNVQQFDLSADLLAAILWQYDDSPAITALARAEQAFYDSAVVGFWNDWYRDVFNIDTANDFGLAVWARILDIPLEVIAPPTENTEVSFGFAPSGGNFGNSNFGRWREGNVALTRRQKRIVVRLRYFGLTHAPTLDNINRFLREYFWQDQSRVFVVDPLNMEYVVYTFGQDPGAELKFILEKYDLLPRPSTVGTVYIITPRRAWGFGPHKLNFRPGANFGA